MQVQGEADLLALHLLDQLNFGWKDSWVWLDLAPVLELGSANL